MAIDSSIVQILDKNFNVLYQTYSDATGFYEMEVAAGTYMAMYVIRPKEYPRENKVSEDKMRLEFWAWNIVAYTDITINPKYDRLELYGTQVFEIPGAHPGLVIYTRPMSLQKLLSYSKDASADIADSERRKDISVSPNYLEFTVSADDELLEINSVQMIEEYTGEGEIPMIGYILQVGKPLLTSVNPYYMITVTARNKEFNEMGENIFFYEYDKYK